MAVSMPPSLPLAGVARQRDGDFTVEGRIDVAEGVFGGDDEANAGASGDVCRRLVDHYQLAGCCGRDGKAFVTTMGNPSQVAAKRESFAGLVERQASEVGQAVDRVDAEGAGQRAAAGVAGKVELHAAVKPRSTLPAASSALMVTRNRYRP